MTRPGTKRETHLSAPDPACDEADHPCEAGAMSRVDTFYRAHAGRLIAQLAKRAGCKDDAREIVHEAVTRLLARGAFRNPSIRHIDAYVAEASHNLLTDQGRSKSRFTQIKGELSSNGPQHVDQVVVLETRDRLRRLEQAMHKLKPRTRSIFLAHRLRGLSYAEIAAETGLSVKGVEKQMAKAIAKLSHFLDRS